MTRIRRHHRGWPVARALQVEAIARAKAGREAGGSSGQPDEASVAEPGARRGRGRGSLAGPVESPPRKELGFSSKCNGKPRKGVYVRSDMLWSAAPSHPPEG